MSDKQGVKLKQVIGLHDGVFIILGAIIGNDFVLFGI